MQQDPHEANACAHQLDALAQAHTAVGAARFSEYTCLASSLAWRTGTTGQNAARLMITLTSKERRALELVARGQSNKEMAKWLCVTLEIIKSHMKHIFSKLQVDSRAQAAVTAKACGLI